MEKRLLVTIALSMLVIVAWSTLTSKPQPVVNKGVATETFSVQKAESAVSASAAVSEEGSGAPETVASLTLDSWDIDFIESSAAIKDVKFRAYQNTVFTLKRGFALADKSLVFKKTDVGPDSITFLHTDAQKRITKKFKFHKSNYTIGLEVKIENLSGSPINYDLPVILGVLDFSSNNPEGRFEDVAISSVEKTAHFNPRKEANISEVKFIGFRDRYFCGIIQPETSVQTGYINKLSDRESEVGLVSAGFTIPPHQQIGHLYRIYLGPQKLESLNQANPAWAAIINFGTFDFIAQILLQFLEFIYKLVHSWGWTIVIFSISVYALLYPLTMKQMRSMKEMQVLQPKIEVLRKTYKDNPQRLNKEIMELYKEHKVNPFSGCLPLVLQMPIFFALYQVLMRSVALKGTSFLWIKDLSQPDRLFVFSNSVPILGNEINILPVLMTIGMFVQQKMTTVSADSATAEQQKIMTLVFPLMFGVLFYRMPSGLVLYWFINSTLMLASQIRSRRKT